MKVVLLTSDHNLASNTAIKTLLESRSITKNKIDIVAILVIQNVGFNKRSWFYVTRFIKTSGLWFVVKFTAINLWQSLCIKVARYTLGKKERSFFEIQEMCQKLGIDYASSDNINSKKSENFIKKHNPEVIVSCLLLQKVKKNILNLPHLGSINFHPALFQEHRGTFSAFWALLRNHLSSGATIHYMTENLDEGRVILQKRFFVKPSDTIFCINQKSAYLGGRLLAKALVKIKRKQARGKLIKKLSQIVSQPSHSQVSAFEQRGKRLIKLRDLLQV